MRVLFLFILSFIMVLKGFSQNVITRTNGTFTVDDPRLMASKNFIPPRYADTTAANAQIGVDSCGALIFTHNTNDYWKRACNPKRWIVVGAAGETITADNGVTKTGNNFELGGIFTSDRILTNSGNSTLTITGSYNTINEPFVRIINTNTSSTASPALRVTASGSNTAISAIGGSIGVSGGGTTGVSGSGSLGVQGFSNTVGGIGVQGWSTISSGQIGVPLRGLIQNSASGTGNTVNYGLEIERQSGAAVAAGLGTGINYRFPSFSNAGGSPTGFHNAAQERIIASNLFGSSTDYRYEFHALGDSVMKNILTLNGDGDIVFPQYAGTNLDVSDLTGYKIGIIDNSGNLRKYTGSLGSTYSFINGLTESGGTAKWGGTLSENTAIDVSSFNVTFNGTGTGGTPVRIFNTGTGNGLFVSTVAGTNGIAVSGNSSNSTAVSGISASGYGLSGTSTSNIGAYISTTSGVSAGVFEVNPSSTNTSQTLLQLKRYTSGTATNNIAGRVEFITEPNSGTVDVTSGYIESGWEDATFATRKSWMSLYTTLNGVTARKFNLASSGLLTLDGYSSLPTETDSTTIKPLGMDAVGGVYRMTNWIGGGGTSGVSSVGVTDGSGFDLSVANPTTTPNISLTTTLSTNSIPFIGASGVLSQDNTNFNFQDGTDELFVPNVRSPTATDLTLRASTSQKISMVTGGQERMAINNGGAITFNNGSESYTLPAFRATVAGQVLTDGAADGSLSWITPFTLPSFTGIAYNNGTTLIAATIGDLLQASGSTIQFHQSYMTSLPNNQIRLKSRMVRQSFTVADADFTTLSTRQEGMFILPDITANRSFNMFSGTGAEGHEFYIYNDNTTGNTWSFAGVAVRKASDGSTVTNLANGVLYHILGLFVQGSARWIIVNQ